MCSFGEKKCQKSSPFGELLSFPKILLDEVCLLISISGRIGNVAVFDNKQIVTIEHIEKAIKNSTAIYPDVINKGIVSLREEFKDLFKQEEDLRKDFLRNE